MKTYEEMEVELCGQLHAPVTLPPGKDPSVPIG
jgi:hypothetical protein